MVDFNYSNLVDIMAYFIISFIKQVITIDFRNQDIPISSISSVSSIMQDTIMVGTTIDFLITIDFINQDFIINFLITINFIIKDFIIYYSKVNRPYYYFKTFNQDNYFSSSYLDFYYSFNLNNYSMGIINCYGNFIKD